MAILTLSPGNNKTITIHACKKESKDKLKVRANEKYLFQCEVGQKWKDWFIPCGPDGFFNPFAIISGLRVKGVKCFCLCGSFEGKENSAFSIGSRRELTFSESGKIFFFPNDAPGAYDNNRGSIEMRIMRVG